METQEQPKAPDAPTQEQLAEQSRKAYESMQQRAADQCAAMCGYNPR